MTGRTNGCGRIDLRGSNLFNIGVWSWWVGSLSILDLNTTEGAMEPGTGAFLHRQILNATDYVGCLISSQNQYQ